MQSRFTVNGVEMNVLHQGSGPVLLVVHGFPLDHSMWRYQIDGLESLRIVAPDLRGFGKTETPDGPTSMDQYADDLASLLNALAVRQPVTLCGLSMGGYIAFSFLRRHGDRVARLILCDTRAGADSDRGALERQELAQRVLRDGVESLAQGMTAKLFAEATRVGQPQVVEDMRAVMQRTDPRGAAAALLAMAARPDSTDILASIRVPTLVICGAQDAIATVAEMRGLAEAIPGSQFVEVPQAGHMAPLEQPEAVNAAIRQFLRDT